MKNKINSAYKFFVHFFGRHFQKLCGVILAVMSPIVFTLYAPSLLDSVNHKRA